MKMSRSRLFATAMAEFIERRRNLELPNLSRASAPGNVLLGSGEANLPKKSVVNVSHVFTIDKAALVKRIGALPGDRVGQVLEGIRLLTEPRDIE